MKKLFYLVFIFIFSCSPLKKYNRTSQKWEVDIAKLEKLDNYEKYYKNKFGVCMYWVGFKFMSK